MRKKSSFLISLVLFSISIFGPTNNIIAQRTENPKEIIELFKPVRTDVIAVPEITESITTESIDHSEYFDNNGNIEKRLQDISSKQIDQSLNSKTAETDSLALVSLYLSTNGDNWNNNNNWLTGPVASWYGITVNNEGSVSQIRLRSNNLIGPLPEEIGDLNELEALYLGNNELTGEIPESIGRLENIVIISLISNDISGSIPASIGQLDQLFALELSNNSISGTLPAEIGSLINLELLYLSSNQLSGEIPDNIGSLTALSALDLSNNQLSGIIPSQIGNLTNLEYLILGSNNLSGEIPVEISTLNKLLILRLWFNQLSGEIPDQLSSLTNLNELYLNNNKLSGNIPVQLGYMSNLENLDLGGNLLSGSIPAELGNLSKLTNLSLYNNELSGTLPPQLGNLVNLTSLLLGNNQLEGSVPTELGNLSNLVQFWLMNNQLTDLPVLSNLQNLTEFYIQNNYLTFSDFLSTGLDFSSIPFLNYSPQYDLEISKSVTEEHTTLDFISSGAGNTLQWYNDGEAIDSETSSSITLNNNDVGIIYCEIRNSQYPDLVLRTIPYFLNFSSSHGIAQEEYDALSALYHATGGENWSENTGWLSDAPVEEWYGIVVRNCRVHEINLNGNHLSGKMPKEIGAFPKMTYLNLSNNELSDTIPSELSELKDLVYLYLYNNLLSGSIPADISKLSHLAVLYLYNNNLEGIIPPELGDLSSLLYMALSYNQLSGSVPSELNKLSNLLRLHINDNILEDLPVLSGLTNLELLELENNHLSFFDFQNTGLDFSNITSFYYAPQYEIDAPVQTASGDNIVLNIQEVATGDEFKWFESDNYLTGNTTNELTINAGTSGIYYCEITNPAFPWLTLNTKPVFIDIANSHGIIQDEYDALQALYNSTSGDLWNISTNWLSDMPVEFWYGITTEKGHVIDIVLSENNLTGQLPTEIGNFSSLEFLYLLDNQIGGNIPEELYELTELKELWLRYNLLEGEISSSISKLTNLEVLQLRNNNLHGNIPQQIGLLQNLTGINLSDNDFTGPLPETLNSLEKLKYLYGFNMDIDALPDLSSLSNLSIFHVYGNQLSFEDLAATGIDFNTLDFAYSPQDSLKLLDDIIGIPEDESYTINFNDLCIKELVNENNEYQLFRDNTLVQDWSTSNSYSINNFSSEDEGSYILKIRNDSFPALTLVSDTFSLFLSRVYAAPTDIELSSSSIDENIPVSTIVAQLSSVDTDLNDSFVYTLVPGDGTNDADNSAFSIDGVYLKTSIELDYETKNEYKINIQTEDLYGLTYTESFIIYVNDVLEQNILENGEEQDFLVFPNPALESFQVKIKDPDDCYLEIIDLQGRLIYTQIVEATSTSLYLSLPAGSYFIKIIKPDKHFIRKLIIK